MKKFLIKVNGNEYEVEVDEIRDGLVHQEVQKVQAQAPASVAQISAPAAPVAQAKPSNDVPAGATKITSPMPGTILNVNVNTGDDVKKGQVLLILEAMKMENEIVSPNDGKITSVNVSKGSSVSAGDVMISMT